MISKVIYIYMFPREIQIGEFRSFSYSKLLPWVEMEAFWQQVGHEHMGWKATHFDKVYIRCQDANPWKPSSTVGWHKCLEHCSIRRYITVSTKDSDAHANVVTLVCLPSLFHSFLKSEDHTLPTPSMIYYRKVHMLENRNQNDLGRTNFSSFFPWFLGKCKVLAEMRAGKAPERPVFGPELQGHHHDRT